MQLTTYNLPHMNNALFLLLSIIMALRLFSMYFVHLIYITFPDAAFTTGMDITMLLVNASEVSVLNFVSPFYRIALPTDFFHLTDKNAPTNFPLYFVS